MNIKFIKFIKDLRDNKNILDEEAYRVLDLYRGPGWSVWNRWPEPDADSETYTIRLSSPTYATMRKYRNSKRDIQAELTTKLMELAENIGIKLLIDEKKCYAINPDRVVYEARIRPLTENKYEKMYEKLHIEIDKILTNDPNAIIITAQQKPNINKIPGAVYLDYNKYFK